MQQVTVKRKILDVSAIKKTQQWVDEKLPTYPIRIIAKKHHAAAAAALLLGSVELKGSETWKVGVAGVYASTPAWITLTASSGSAGYLGTLFLDYIPGGQGNDYGHRTVKNPYTEPCAIIPGPGTAFARVISAGSAHDFGCDFEGPSD